MQRIRRLAASTAERGRGSRFCPCLPKCLSIQPSTMTVVALHLRGRAIGWRPLLPPMDLARS
jgi:hypothetical protein